MSSVLSNTRYGEPVGDLLRKYFAVFSGDGIRVFIQLVYFYLVANTLSLSEFGLFATASATGIVLSRIAAIGFISPLYRIATVKPQLIGVYTAGYLAALGLSLPLVVAAGATVYLLLFDQGMSALTFALIAGTEILLWRTLEVVINVNKGLERFGRASLLIVFGFTMKALAAGLLAMSAFPSLATWAAIYFVTQGIMAMLAVAIFYPRRKLRFRPALYRRRIGDALAVSGSDVLFYAQSELDKLVVLAAGGSVSAGLYAIIMRLIDLTAMPVRSFSTLLVQRLMRRPDMLGGWKARALVEAGIFAVSTAAMAAIVLVFTVKPDILGSNVASAGALLGLVLLVPAFRNLIEYQAELLYGRGQSLLRMFNYGVIGALKAVLLLALLSHFGNPEDWLIWTNAVFATLYAISFALTYRAMRRPPTRV
ncbi:lipopolysaccharide biosynthesis protein [Oricola cellulosilytica]|uniref:Lipopolysaccharide biosynthesis protein n=1 Tax=Oricola cellulosilytica TaxID=1429082 RepID=A0A4V2MP90_9HYPH|nr:lipopolysaccharide biosynthesis protein [Oricola cellulosilytica]TCD16572.1 lipopolysaccharide biosynthesis protein [Oricola cellulosilytica]